MAELRNVQKWLGHLLSVLCGKHGDKDRDMTPDFVENISVVRQDPSLEFILDDVLNLARTYLDYLPRGDRCAVTRAFRDQVMHINPKTKETYLAQIRILGIFYKDEDRVGKEAVRRAWDWLAETAEIWGQGVASKTGAGGTRDVSKFDAENLAFIRTVWVRSLGKEQVFVQAHLLTYFFARVDTGLGNPPKHTQVAEFTMARFNDHDFKALHSLCFSMLLWYLEPHGAHAIDEARSLEMHDAFIDYFQQNRCVFSH